jgi:hypothetical protein
VALKFWNFGFKMLFYRSFRKNYKIHIFVGGQKPYSTYSTSGKLKNSIACHRPLYPLPQSPKTMTSFMDGPYTPKPFQNVSKVPNNIQAKQFLCLSLWNIRLKIQPWTVGGVRSITEFFCLLFKLKARSKKHHV